MSTISLRLNDADYELVQGYVKTNNLSLSSFAREAILDKIEDDLALDEKRILAARKQAKLEEAYDIEDVWKEMGL